MDFSEKVITMAQKIAEECQGHSKAYCATRCPMHTDVIGYVNLIKDDKVEEALLKIREKLFLPATLGRICAHPCEDECRRCKEYKQPIAIATLKRYAADTADKEELWDISKKPPTGKKVAVIGAGPAGAQAAINLTREGHSVTVYDKLDVYGGMMRVGIPAYRLPRNIIDFEYKYLELLGVEFKMGVEIGKDISFEQLQSQYDAVVIANGAHKGSKIPTKGDQCQNITTAVDFLKLASLEEKATVPCGEVVVIGGGDVAMDCARTSLRLGARKVNLVSLETLETLPASSHEQKWSLQEGVIFNCGYGTMEILNKDDKVSGVIIRECTSIFDGEGKFNPQYTDKTQTISCDTLIFATGQVVEDVTSGLVEQGRAGRYIADPDTLATKVSGVFIAGDCSSSNIVVEAMALGTKAATSVNLFLEGKALDTDRDFIEEYSYISKLDIPLPKDAVDKPRCHANEMAAKESIKTFEECDFGFDRETALAESDRCFKCECKKCMEECIMLNDYTGYPGELFQKFMETRTLEPIVAYSCNMCDQCTIVCPEEYKFAELFGEIRKDMVKANGGKSPMPGHKAINFHQLLGFSKIFSIARKGRKK